MVSVGTAGGLAVGFDDMDGLEMELTAMEGEGGMDVGEVGLTDMELVGDEEAGPGPAGMVGGVQLEPEGPGMGVLEEPDLGQVGEEVGETRVMEGGLEVEGDGEGGLGFWWLNPGFGGEKAGWGGEDCVNPRRLEGSGGLEGEGMSGEGALEGIEESRLEGFGNCEGAG